MTLENKARVFTLFLFVLSEVTPWTIDLPEIRRRFFKDDDKGKTKETDYQRYANGNQVFYSNSQGNSKHNADDDSKIKHYEDAANEYYQSHTDKKVQVHVVHNGGAYLEGLRLALEEYIRLIEECNKSNLTNQYLTANSSWTVPVSPSPRDMTMPDNLPQPRLQNVTDYPMIPQTNNSTRVLRPNTNGSSSRMTCQEATKASERVRQYAKLAAWATRRLQDLTYAGQYQKTDFYEENELILKLAWFLDQLASLTGYEPDYKRYVHTTTSTTSTIAPIPNNTLVPQNQELIDFLIGCIKMDSPVPATVRCKYPEPLPENVAEIVGASTTTKPSPAGSHRTSSLADNVGDQSLELLITGDSNRKSRRITKRSPLPQEYFVPIPVHEKPKPPVVDFILKKLANLKSIVKTVKKNAMADFSSQLGFHKHLHKRAIDDNMARVLNRLAEDLNVKNDESVVKSALFTDKSDKLDDTSDKLDDKSDKLDDKSDKLDDKSDELIVKIDGSDVKKDESSDKFDDFNIKSPLYLPLTDEVVVSTKSFKKRSIDDPLENLSNYYLKYKVWDGSNPTEVNNNENPTNFDVSNGLPSRTITKRSLFPKKSRHLKTIQLLQLLNSNKNKNAFQNGKPKLLTYVNNMIGKKYENINDKNKNTHKINKRTVEYKRMYLPRIPDNPVGDISYYVKNKRGHNYNPSLTQAAQIRRGLQRVFDTGNLAVVERFGSNYNPAVPDPFNAGIMKSMADS